MMSRYDLFRGDARLGTIEHTDDDFPWHLGTIDPTPAFEAVRALFERESALVEGSADSEEWRAARGLIDEPGLRLVDADGRTIAVNPLLHIRAREVWWR
jgi:hypothetical protein